MTITRVGVVGCGAVVRNNYTRALSGIRGIKVTAVHDLDPVAAAEVAAMFSAAALSFEELCGRVDAVIIATPPSTHVGLVKACIERGLTVLCEKPFVSRESEAVELVKLSAARGVSVCVGHLRRTFPSARLARDMIATGALGRVRALSLIEGGRFAWDTSSNYVVKDVSGGVLFDTGSHTVDMGLFVSGLDLEEFTVVVDAVKRDRPEPAHEVRADLRLRVLGAEVPLHLHVSRHRALANRVRVELEHGVVDLSVGPRDRIRVTGPLGTAIIPSGPLASDFNGYFTEQFVRILVERRTSEFSVERFVGLTKVLEAIASQKESE